MIGIENMLGRSRARFGSVNSGKTAGASDDLDLLEHAGYNVVAYQHVNNTRDKGNLVVNGVVKRPAVIVKSARELLEDFKKRREAIFSRKVKYRGEDGVIKFKGIEHRKSIELLGFTIDELSFFCGTPEETAEMVEVTDMTHQEGLVGTHAGLLYDFRHMNMGYTSLLLRHLNPIFVDARCKAENPKTGGQCGRAADRSARLWSLDYALSRVPENTVEDMDSFAFFDVVHRKSSGVYVAAPFFDKTYLVENSAGAVVYLPVCQGCHEVPFAEETHAVYDAVVAGETLDKVGVEPRLVALITDFLVDEKWVQQTDKGLVPSPSYRLDL